MRYTKTYKEYLINEGFIKNLKGTLNNINKLQSSLDDISNKIMDIEKNGDEDSLDITDKKLIKKLKSEAKIIKKGISEEKNFQARIFQKIMLIALVMVVIGGMGGAIRALTVYFDLKWKKEVEKTKSVLRDPSHEDWKKRDKDHKYTSEDEIETKQSIYDVISNTIKTLNNSEISENQIASEIIQLSPVNKQKVFKLLDKIEDDKTLDDLVKNVQNNKSYNYAKKDMIILNNYIIEKYGKTNKKELIDMIHNLPSIMEIIKKTLK